MTPSLPTDSELRRLRLRSQLAAHMRWTLAKTVAGDFTLAAATSHLVWLSELHAVHLAALERETVERPKMVREACSDRLGELPCPSPEAVREASWWPKRALGEPNCNLSARRQMLSFTKTEFSGRGVGHPNLTSLRPPLADSGATAKYFPFWEQPAAPGIHHLLRIADQLPQQDSIGDGRPLCVPECLNRS
jgi:hypothetical protein